MVEGSVRGIELAPSDDVIGDGQNANQRSGRRPILLRRARPAGPAPRTQGRPRKSRRNPGFLIFKTLKRLWIPLVILAVVCAGGFTVSRLHGIFGSEKQLSYADTRKDETKPFNPKHLTYEVFGPPGTVAEISYFDANGDPQRVKGIQLPWSLEFAITTATVAGNIAAQGDSDSISCRILVDGVVKAEKTTEHEVSAFTYCLLKAA